MGLISAFEHVVNVAPEVTATATGNVMTINQGIMGTLGKVGTVIGAVAGICYIGDLVYSKYLDSFDAEILEKFNESDCGGLSKMSQKVEGCYRKYVREAIHRLIKASSLAMNDLQDRFTKCFENRPKYECGFFGEKVFEYQS